MWSLIQKLMQFTNYKLRILYILRFTNEYLIGITWRQDLRTSFFPFHFSNIVCIDANFILTHEQQNDQGATGKIPLKTYSK